MDIATLTINPFSLIYLHSNNKVLLLKRLNQKKLLGGKILGLGGKVESGEDIITSAVREFREETGLELLDPMLKGTYTWVDTNFIGTSHIIVASKYSGELIESNEGELDWYEIDSLHNVKYLAKYQLNFIPYVFDSGYHYNGLSIQIDEEMYTYTDTKPYFSTFSNSPFAQSPPV